MECDKLRSFYKSWLQVSRVCNKSFFFLLFNKFLIYEWPFIFFFLILSKEYWSFLFTWQMVELFSFRKSISYEPQLFHVLEYSRVANKRLWTLNHFRKICMAGTSYLSYNFIDDLYFSNKFTNFSFLLERNRVNYSMVVQRDCPKRKNIFKLFDLKRDVYCWKDFFILVSSICVTLFFLR